MVKGIKRWKINKNYKFTNASINCFPWANTSDMKHYTELPLKKNANTNEVVTIHTGANAHDIYDLTQTEIANNFMDL